MASCCEDKSCESNKEVAISTPQPDESTPAQSCSCCRGHGESADSEPSSCCSGHGETGASESPRPPLPDEVRSASFSIENMCCPVEEGLIRRSLEGLPGIARLDFNVLARQLTVHHTLAHTGSIVAALSAIDMAPRQLEGSGPATHQPARLVVSSKTRLLLGISGAAAFGAEITSWLTGVEDSPLIICLALLSVGCGGLPILKKGWIALRSFTLNINFLMSLAAFGAVAIGQWPEAAVVIFLFALAEVIEELSLDRARHAIGTLMAIAPETALVAEPGGAWREVEAATVKLGCTVRVRPGECIPLDGEVSAGRSTVNQAPITGESMPVAKGPGDSVFAGTINQTGIFEFRVTGDYRHTTLSRIIAAVQKAQGERAPTQRMVDRFAHYYTPAVVLGALAVALVPPLISDAGWIASIYRGLVMLVISCPCALVISTPVTVVSGLAAAARHGILVKGGVYLEQGRRLRSLALDKTGTLTCGTPSLTDLITLAELGAGPALSLAAALDEHASHPVARAILQGFQARPDNPALPPVAHFEYLTGRGVTGEIAGRRYYIGNQRLAESLGIGGERLTAELNRLEAQGKSAVILADEKRALAVFAVADTVRGTAQEAVAALLALGVRPVMLTGDNLTTARAIAESVGIEEVHANLLPEEKLGVVVELQGQGAVGMVGDGINDAPALARADIGFAMGAAGTAAALETADVALMDDDLRKLPDFIRLSRRTWQILAQNIALALGIKAVFLALAAMGLATLWMAVFADMGSSLLVIFNGLRMLNTFNGSSK
jgi:Zn2+/Cd2+-exporting ATPase